MDGRASDKVEELARALLRRLRDLNLFAGPIALTRSRSVTIGGCLSLDGPVEGGVSYRLRLGDGSETVVRLACCAEGIEIQLAGGAPRMRVSVREDGEGRILVEDLGARVSAEKCDGKELEHLLRRVVRTLLARRDAA